MGKPPRPRSRSWKSRRVESPQARFTARCLDQGMDSVLHAAEFLERWAGPTRAASRICRSGSRARCRGRGGRILRIADRGAIVQEHVLAFWGEFESLAANRPRRRYSLRSRALLLASNQATGKTSIPRHVWRATAPRSTDGPSFQTRKNAQRGLRSGSNSRTFSKAARSPGLVLGRTEDCARFNHACFCLGKRSSNSCGDRLGLGVAPGHPVAIRERRQRARVLRLQFTRAFQRFASPVSVASWFRSWNSANSSSAWGLSLICWNCCRLSRSYWSRLWGESFNFESRATL